MTLVDTDSFQVPNLEGAGVYRCRVGKPEFTPPELQNVSFAWTDRKQEHDLFGLAVLVFQLLMEGIHPFAGKHGGSGEAPGLERRIAEGWFPYGPGQHGGIQPMPTAPRFELLRGQIRELFIRCFVNGHSDPSSRPDAQTWQQALLEAEGALSTCSANEQPWYGNHLSSCPWCERLSQLGGVDPFPSHEMVKWGRYLLPVRMKPRPPRPTTQTYESAIAIARAAALRKRWVKRVAAVLLLVTIAGLMTFWVWAIRLAVSQQ